MSWRPLSSTLRPFSVGLEEGPKLLFGLDQDGGWSPRIRVSFIHKSRVNAKYTSQRRYHVSCCSCGLLWRRRDGTVAQVRLCMAPVRLWFSADCLLKLTYAGQAGSNRDDANLLPRNYSCGEGPKGGDLQSRAHTTFCPTQSTGQLFIPQLGAMFSPP